jgi:hypothetical protein
MIRNCLFACLYALGSTQFDQLPEQDPTDLNNLLNQARDLKSTELEIKLAKAYNAKEKARENYSKSKYVLSRLQDSLDDTMYTMACQEEARKRAAYRREIKRFSNLLIVLRTT